MCLIESGSGDDSLAQKFFVVCWRNSSGQQKVNI